MPRQQWLTGKNAVSEPLGSKPSCFCGSEDVIGWRQPAKDGEVGGLILRVGPNGPVNLIDSDNIEIFDEFCDANGVTETIGPLAAMNIEGSDMDFVW